MIMILQIHIKIEQILQMSSKIKLEVNHGKHKKSNKQSSIKVLKPEQNKIKKDENDSVNNKTNVLSKNDNKKEDKDKKSQKTDIKNGKKLKNKQSQSIQKKQKQIPKQKQKQKQVDKELATIERIKDRQQQTRKSIQQLIIQYKDGADDMFTNHGHNPQKQKKIQSDLQKLQRQHRNRLNKLKALDEKASIRSEQKQKKLQKRNNTISQKDKQKRRDRAGKKIELLKNLSQQRLENEAKFQQFYHNQYQSKVPLFKKLQQQFKQKENNEELRRQNKLMQIRKKYTPIDQEQLDRFEDNYHENKWSLQEENQQKKQFQNQLLQKQNNEINERLWRGECHKRIKEQQKERLRIKNQGKTRLQKTKQYGTVVKSQFKPHINPQRRNMSLSIEKIRSEENDNFFNDDISETGLIKQRYKSVARQKYFQGTNKGLVIQKLRKSLDHNQKVLQGNSYLQYVVNLPKTRTDGSQSAQLEQLPSQIPSKKIPSTTFKPKRVRDPYYSISYSEKLPDKGNMPKIRNPEIINYHIAEMRGKQKQMELQEKAVKYGQYNGILQLQERYSNINKKLAQNINQKLQILSRM